MEDNKPIDIILLDIIDKFNNEYYQLYKDEGVDELYEITNGEDLLNYLISRYNIEDVTVDHQYCMRFKKEEGE